MGQVAAMPERTKKGKKQSDIELLTRIAGILSVHRRRELLDFAKFLTEAEEDRIFVELLNEAEKAKRYSRTEAKKRYAEILKAESPG